jgi:hypothetical protein
MGVEEQQNEPRRVNRSIPAILIQVLSSFCENSLETVTRASQRLLQLSGGSIQMVRKSKGKEIRMCRSAHGHMVLNLMSLFSHLQNGSENVYPTELGSLN